MSKSSGISFGLLDDDASRREAEALFGRGGLGADQMHLRGGASRLVVGAHDGQRLVGAAAGEVGPDDARPVRVEQDRLRVVSLAVDREAAGQGVGAGLMRLLRLMAVRRDLRLIGWEQDMLESRLSHLAIHKLGAVSRSLSQGGGSALDVEWWVTSPRVRSKLRAGRPDLELAHVLEAGTPKLNAGRLGEDGLLRPVGAVRRPSSASALVEVPFDAPGLREQDEHLLAEWRALVTELLLSAFVQGYWLTDYFCLRDERFPRAYFLLIDGERTLG